MNKFDIPALCVYNLAVVAITAVSVYYISGWMFALMMAVMSIKHDDKKDSK